MKKLLTTAILAVALGAIVPDSSIGQTANQPGAMRGMMGGGCPMMGMMGRGMMRQGMRGQGGMWRHGRMDAVVEGRLAYLKTELAITDAQKDAWTGYSDAVKARVEVMQSMRQSMMATMHSGNAIDRMEARIQSMEAMVEAMKEVKPATEKLYGVLTDDQKKKADELIGIDCGAM